MVEKDDWEARIMAGDVATMLVLGQILAEIARTRAGSEIAGWVNDPATSRRIGRFVGRNSEHTADLIEASFQEANRILTTPAPDDPEWDLARARLGPR